MVKKEQTKTKLPDGILAADLKYPRFDDKDPIVYEIGDHGHLTFYEVTGYGWCIATLQISNGRQGRAARTYATRISDGGQVRIGQGPHVLQTISVYLKKSRLEALKKYTDLYQSGAVSANVTRDRISSRRAEGTLRRARGESYWRWSS